MKRTTALLTLLFLFAATGFAQEWAKKELEGSSRHGEWVSVKHDSRTVKAFIVYPEVKQKAPVVLVIHEIFGMSDWVRSMADELAAQGYIAIAPDLLSGMGPKGGGSEEFDSDSVRMAVSQLNPDQITADLNAVADYAKNLPAANGKLAVAGFCWGGGQSFRFATNRKDLSAAFVFYGPQPQNLAAITAPVYGFYAGNDARISTTVPATTEAMKNLGKTYEPVIYDGAGHGFMRAGQDPGNKNPANVKARNEGWERMLSILKKL